MPSRKERNDLAGTLGAVLFIVVGGVCWWNIHDINNFDAVIFPKTVIALMVALSALLIVRNMLGFAIAEAAAPPGSVLRRLGLLVAMIIGTLAMPFVGFLIAGLASYLAIMAVAMYERWSLPRRLLYPASGLLVVFAFYFVFKGLFLVPLPEPRWFTWPFS
jgi:putative tricarboxylic transport membrane protein